MLLQRRRRRTVVWFRKVPHLGRGRFQTVTRLSGRAGPVTHPRGNGSSRRANAPGSSPRRALTGSHRLVARPPASKPACPGRMGPAKTPTPGSAHPAIAVNRMSAVDERLNGDGTWSPREAWVPVEAWGTKTKSAGRCGSIGCEWILRPDGSPSSLGLAFSLVRQPAQLRGGMPGISVRLMIPPVSPGMWGGRNSSLQMHYINILPGDSFARPRAFFAAGKSSRQERTAGRGESFRPADIRLFIALFRPYFIPRFSVL